MSRSSLLAGSILHERSIGDSRRVLLSCHREHSSRQPQRSACGRDRESYRDCPVGDGAEADATRPRSAPGGPIDGSEEGTRRKPRRALPRHIGTSEGSGPWVELSAQRKAGSARKTMPSKIESRTAGRCWIRSRGEVSTGVPGLLTALPVRGSRSGVPGPTRSADTQFLVSLLWFERLSRPWAYGVGVDRLRPASASRASGVGAGGCDAEGALFDSAACERCD